MVSDPHVSNPFATTDSLGARTCGSLLLDSCRRGSGRQCSLPHIIRLVLLICNLLYVPSQDWADSYVHPYHPQLPCVTIISTGHFHICTQCSNQLTEHLKHRTKECQRFNKSGDTPTVKIWDKKTPPGAVIPLPTSLCSPILGQKKNTIAEVEVPLRE